MPVSKLAHKRWGYLGIADTCLWCGGKLKKDHNNPDMGTVGVYGNGYFCSLACAYYFGVMTAQCAVRLKFKKGVFDVRRLTPEQEKHVLLKRQKPEQKEEESNESNE